MNTGRNEPCPCGSGRKYKKCCMQRGPDPINYIKEKLDRFHERIIGELLRHGAKVFGPGAIDEAMEEFFCWWGGEDLEESDLDYHGTLFYPWFLFKWRIDPNDDESAIEGPPNITVTESYLRLHGHRLDPVERAYLENFAAAPFTFFEVTAVEQKKNIVMRDIFTGRVHRVLDYSASGVLRQGDVVFGSAFEAGAIGLFGALGRTPFRPSDKVEILATRGRIAKATEGEIAAETLEEYDIELRDLYFHLSGARRASPTLCNTDGDTLAFHTLHYAISSPQMVFDALKGLTNGFADPEDLLEEAEYDRDGTMRKVEVPWLLPANEKHAGMENTVHGRLIIDGLKMTCEVNSAERAARLRAIIEESLPEGGVAYKTTVIQSPDAMLRNAESSAAVDDTEHQELLNHPEVKARLDQMMRTHWDKWIDMELPALLDRTPRQAVADELGREQVAALLEDAERRCREADGSLGSMENLERVWRALGFERP